MFTTLVCIQVGKSANKYPYTMLLHSVIVTQPLIVQCLSDLNITKMIHGEMKACDATGKNVF